MPARSLLPSSQQYHGPECAQQLISPPPRPRPRRWENNNGYCGEVSLIASGMALGQWTSQLNARAVASPFSPPAVVQTSAASCADSDCAYPAQMLLDDVQPRGVTNIAPAANNLKLVGSYYDSRAQASGTAVRTQPAP
jgi:hypothetical protein